MLLLTLFILWTMLARDGMAVTCPDQPAENFCDCDGDCTEHPDWCSCDEARECCAAREEEMGCCFDMGFGAMMKPCCHSVNDAHAGGRLTIARSECPTEDRMGGKTAFVAGKGCDEMDWFEDDDSGNKDQPEQVITGTIFCDNYFEFWFNGELIAKDPVDFCPHQAVEVEFTWDGKSPKTYAILCQDFMNLDYGASGFEYVEVPVWDEKRELCCHINSETRNVDDCRKVPRRKCPTSCPPNKGVGFWETFENSDRCDKDGSCHGCGPWIGDGSLLAEFSDGTITNKEWKVFVKSFGPTDKSLEAGCTYTNLAPCEVDFFDEPEGWREVGFDDSRWPDASEYTPEETGWGLTPRYEKETGLCCGLRTQGRKPADPECVKLPEHECRLPKEVLCVGSEKPETCPDGPYCNSPACDRVEDPKMIWSDDLQRAQQIFFRYTSPPPRGKDDEKRCETDAVQEGTRYKGKAKKGKVASLCDCEEFCRGEKGGWAVSFKANKRQPAKGKCSCHIKRGRKDKVKKTKGYQALLLEED